MFRSQQLSERPGGKVDDNSDNLRGNQLPAALKGNKYKTTLKTYGRMS